jgi:predicted secreted hydrolase
MALLVILSLAMLSMYGDGRAQTPMSGVGTPSPFVETGAGRNDAPIPVQLPRDDAPHDVGIEWWYYTGHLFTDSGERYGFEYVIFNGHRGDVPGYAAHFAITDNARGVFRYDQRLGLAPDTPLAATGFDLRVGDWQMCGSDGTDHLVASMPGYGIDLSLRSTKPAALHDGDGYFDYGSGEGSYYYSRTRLAISGTLTVDGQPRAIVGEAWFDHQWGNFSTYQGGWDWYALQLDNETEVMLYIIHGLDGGPLIVDGSFIAADGTLTILDRGDFTLSPTGTWTSPHSGATYPAGWIVKLSAQDLSLVLSPSMPDQELDTTASTNVIYWEGEVRVAGTQSGQPIAGLGYVELTGYAKTGQPSATPGP